MKLRYGEAVLEGRALTVGDLDVDGATLAAAVDGESPAVTIEAPDPGPLYEFVGHVRPGMGVQRRRALAVAARSRGLTAPQDDELATVRAELGELDPPAVSGQTARREAADAAGETERLRERVAELRGRVQALRERGADASAAADELATAARELSERETAQIAAGERLDAERSAARESRDVRDRRLRLQDRAANLEREARAALADRIEPEFADAVRALPTNTPTIPGDAPGETVALAVARVGAVVAPMVLEEHPFSDAESAARWLDAPVLCP